MFQKQRIVKVHKEGILDQSYSLYIGEKWFDGGNWFGQVASVAFEDAGEAVELPPTYRMKEQECQMLMDSLWDAGIRPTEGSGSAGSLSATQYHLEDMRKIALKP